MLGYLPSHENNQNYFHAQKNCACNHCERRRAELRNEVQRHRAKELATQVNRSTHVELKELRVDYASVFTAETKRLADILGDMNNLTDEIIAERRTYLIERMDELKLAIQELNIKHQSANKLLDDYTDQLSSEKRAKAREDDMSYRQKKEAAKLDRQVSLKALQREQFIMHMRAINLPDEQISALLIKKGYLPLT